ncbi:retrovirus-related pol polyprotein from transposon TNT 1-94 [Tanacetum coccineum]
MITTDIRIQEKKPLELILPPMDILETFPCVKDVDYITRDLAVSSVRKGECREYYKSLKKEPLQMGTVSDVITGGNRGAVQQGPVRARVLKTFRTGRKGRYKADIRATKSHLPQTHNNQHRASTTMTEEKTNSDLWFKRESLWFKMSVEEQRLIKEDHCRENNAEEIGHIARNSKTKATSRFRLLKDTMPTKQAQESGAVLDEEQSLFLAGEQVTNVDDDVDDSQENDLALNVDHIFEADECDAFDSDVDEGPTSQTMFMANLTSEDPIYDEAGPSYDSNNPFEVQDHDAFVDHMDEYHDVHEMQNDVQHNYVVESDADYTSDSNIIPYVEDNEEHVVQCNASFVRNDALMSILDEMHEQGVQSRLTNKPDIVVNDSVTSELARYKELVGENDNNHEKAETLAPKPISALTVYPPNTPVKLVPRILPTKIARVNDRSREPYNAVDVTALIEQNDCDRVELEKVKQHYKELYDSIKITRAHTSEKTSTMLNEIESLKAQLRSKEPCFTSDYVKPKVLAPGMYAIDVKPIPHPFKNNRSAHLNYISHLKEQCDWHLPKKFNERDYKAPSYALSKDKCKRNDSTNSKWRSKPRSNTKKNRILLLRRHGMCVVNILNSVNATPTVRIVLNKEKQIWKPKGKMSDNRLNKTKQIWKPKGKLSDNSLNKTKQIWKPKGKLSDNSLYKTKRVWKATGKLFADIGYQWRPTGKKLALGKLDCGSQWRPTGKKFALGEMCHLTKLSVVQVMLWYLDSGCSKHMTGNRSKLMNFVEKFIGSVRFGNDHLGAIMGYGDYVMGDSVISRVYYVEGLGHNLFSVGQFCDSDLEVAFRKHTCFVRDNKGTDILKGSRGTNLYTISIDEMMKSSPICLLSKASKSKSWLWHRRLNHLNFGTINDLARKDLVRGLPRLKFEKDHLCSACQLGKSKKFSHRPKSENTNMEVLHTLHMDLCGPMRVQSIKGKKYILVIVDDYSRFTWVKFLRSKDETPEFVTNFLKQIQVGLNKTVRFIRTDNGTEFVNQVMSEYYEGVGIFHQKSVPRTPQQNGVVERRNRTLVEAARTMMIFSKAPMFLWAEAVATACYTQNRSLIHTRHNKTPYELVHDKKPDLTFFRVFGALCYPTNDSEDLGKFQAKADIGIFVGYAPSRKGYRIYNKRTRRLMETIHVTFDEMHQSMAPVRISSGPEPIMMTPGQLKSGLAPTDKELEMLFQPMFDEHLEQSRVNEPVPSATEINAQVVPPGTSLSTTIAQDAPSTSASSSTSDIHHPVQHQEIAEEPTHEDTPINHDVLHPSHNLVTGDPGLAQSSSGNVNSAEPIQVNYPPDHLRRWTKDHPLDNIVGNPSRPVSTRKQLASDALWCCFHTELSKVEPKNFKIAVIEDCWFQAMQDEI